MRMRGVLDDHELVFPGDRHDGVHVGRLAGEVHRDDGPRARRDHRFDSPRVEVEGVEVDVGEDRDGVGFDDCGSRCIEGVRRDDDLILTADPGGEQSQSQRDSAIHDADAVPAAAHRGETLLELDHLRAAELSPVAAAQGLQQALFVG